MSPFYRRAFRDWQESERQRVSDQADAYRYAIEAERLRVRKELEDAMFFGDTRTASGRGGDVIWTMDTNEVIDTTGHVKERTALPEGKEKGPDE